MSTPELPDSIAGNIADWTRSNEQYTDARAEVAWAPQPITWGVFGVREDEIGSPLGDVAGLDVVELGCGTAYFSAQMAHRGARPVGVDPTPAQLATARRMQEQMDLHFPLVEAPAERVPLPDASFDLAFSEFGASLWADPILWIPEAARLLRPGGRLVFLTNSLLAALCMPDRGPATEQLVRDQRGLRRVSYPDDDGQEFHLAHGEWIATLARHGFAVDALHELYAPEGASPTRFEWITPEWARRWPIEEIWIATRLTGGSGPPA